MMTMMIDECSEFIYYQKHTGYQISWFQWNLPFRNTMRMWRTCGPTLKGAQKKSKTSTRRKWEHCGTNWTCGGKRKYTKSRNGRMLRSTNWRGITRKHSAILKITTTTSHSIIWPSSIHSRWALGSCIIISNNISFNILILIIALSLPPLSPNVSP